MSETLNNKHENLLPNKEAYQESKIESHEVEALAKESAEAKKEQLETARTTIEEQAESKEKFSPHQETNETNQPHHYITKQIKSEGYKKTIKHVQKRLSPTEVKFSRLIHQPKIEAISEIGAKTIARPSAIISGGVLSLLIGIVFILVAKRIGFYVSPLVFSVLFVAGYFLGIVFELIIRTLMKLVKRKPHYQKSL